jgi:hypothetical protein
MDIGERALGREGHNDVVLKALGYPSVGKGVAPGAVEILIAVAHQLGTGILRSWYPDHANYLLVLRL